MDKQFGTTPVMVYSVNLLLAGLAFLLLQHGVVLVEGPDRPLRRAGLRPQGQDQSGDLPGRHNAATRTAVSSSRTPRSPAAT
jgi:hypothetical protein